MDRFNKKLNLILESAGVLGAAEKFVEIWNQYAKIDPHVEEVELDDSDDPEDIEEFIEDFREYGLTITSVGDKWGDGSFSQKEEKVAETTEKVGRDIANYASEVTGSKIYAGWHVNRGAAHFVMQATDAYDVKNFHQISGGYGDEEGSYKDYEADFVNRISESKEMPIKYETFIDDISKADPETVKRIKDTVKSPFVQSVLSILEPHFDKKQGRYGTKVTSDSPPWFGSGSAGLKRAADKDVESEFITFELHDAEGQFPVEVHQMLQKSEHKISGRPVAWASGFNYPDQGVLAIIELQSDIMRRAAEVLTGENVQYLDDVMEGFSDWQDVAIGHILDQAREWGHRRVKFPTARKLGRFWRAANQNPNMKVMKTLYDKKFRDIAKKEHDWWVIDLV